MLSWETQNLQIWLRNWRGYLIFLLDHYGKQAKILNWINSRHWRRCSKSYFRNSLVSDFSFSKPTNRYREIFLGDGNNLPWKFVYDTFFPWDISFRENISISTTTVSSSALQRKIPPYNHIRGRFINVPDRENRNNYYKLARWNWRLLGYICSYTSPSRLAWRCHPLCYKWLTQAL